MKAAAIVCAGIDVSQEVRGGVIGARTLSISAVIVPIVVSITTLRKVRTFREVEGHRFVRWAEMVRRAAAA